MSRLVTTLGDLGLEDLRPGLLLPHEHIFVDMRGADHPDLGDADVGAVIALMAPELVRAREAGIAALVVCTPVGVGRRADIELAVSRAGGMPLVVPTGLYREPWIPRWAREARVQELQAWMVGELEGEIGHSGVQAGWIKLSAGDDGLTPVETKVLRAAAAAGGSTGAVIGSHTVRGRVALDQLDIIEQAGYDPARFIWIHAQNEPDLDLHTAIARRGAWVEYDAIGSSPESDGAYIKHIHRMLDAGFGEQVLLSHDRGWYDPAKPGGGEPRPFTYLPATFLPKLRASGVSDNDLWTLTRTNPFRAFAR
jgi:phosphotriesterase-related protein